MKKRSTTPVSKSLAMRGSLLAIAILMAAAAPVAFMGNPTAARDFDAEIRAVQRQIDRYNGEAAKLAKEADTLANKVAKLNSEKATVQAQIDLSQKKHDKLVADIAENEKKIADNQEALGKTMADMYVDDDISPLEMLASSNNIADYIDKQTQRSSIRDSLSETIAEIKRLKAELEQQRNDVKRVLEDQKNQRKVLAAKQAEQQRLLDATKGKEAAYQRLSAEGSAKRREIEKAQAAAIAAQAAQGGGYTALPGDPNSGGYPAKWRNAPMNAYVDDWGMYSRQCVSYAAWKVQSVYGNMPYWGGIGNANQWGDNARAAGIKVNGVPAPGTVGVQYSGQYGHVGWVEQVHGDGTMTISQFNAGWSGEFSRWRVSTSFFHEYIYFGG